MCSVVICIRTMVTPTNLPQTVSSGYTPTSAMFVFQATSCDQLSAVSEQWLHSHLHLQTCHRLSPVATHLLQLSFFPGYQWCTVVSCLPQTVSSENTPSSTVLVFQATSGVQLSAAWHRLYPGKTHLLQLSLFSRLPVVFSCQLYQDSGYTYKPATDCLEWLHIL